MTQILIQQITFRSHSLISRRMVALLFIIGTAVIRDTWGAQLPAVDAPSVSPPPIDFLKDIQPLLSRCTSCHGIEHQEAGLNLQVRAAAQKGSDSGPVIVPGKPEESLLFQRVTSTDPQTVMPPPEENKQLSSAQVDMLKRWIAAGAVWPDSAEGSGTNHLAYKPPSRPPLPTVKDTAWVRQPWDAFVLMTLEQKGWQPTAAADRATWLRRVSLDLIGLPPTPTEVTAFLQDESPDAYEKVVERLLASPRYGERWASYWLDLARYADTNGYEKDGSRVMWLYRDWVIGAFNRDLPFDQFTIEQLAGDLLPNATPEQRIATGFHRNTMINTEGGVDPEEYRNVVNVDRVNTTAAVWLATTLNCAQCHTHKYDPFKQKEYYQLLAFFNNNADSATGESVVEEFPTPAQAAALAELDAHEKIPHGSVELKPLRDKINELRNQIRGQIPRTMIMRDQPEPRKTHIHIRGSFLNPGEEVTAGFPAVLSTASSAPNSSDSAANSANSMDNATNRLALARWLVDRQNPLTARVLVNRMWEQFFGRGIVGTSEDFGTRGDTPTHPELLDWLAVEFMERGWSLKQLHRSIVLSATYRQGATATTEAIARDPDNRWLARGPRQRLTAEMIRDQALFVAGMLSEKMGGPSVMPPQPEGIWNSPYNGDQWKTSEGEDRYRRGVYTFIKRTAPYPTMLTFDAPSREICVVKRNKSNTPLAALVTLNDPVYVEAAQGLARRLLREGTNTAERISLGYRLVTARDVRPAELATLTTFVEQERARLNGDESAARAIAGNLEKDNSATEQAVWTLVGNVLLNLDEVLCR
ncbi:MAG: PSD1 and planctomycete cytochrome C domain-containing protein [Pirellulales bacterium]|nr:PSD1 and planctomycete cytochrome C domain-containing protein [Pirellulales bacterium]